MSSIEVAKGISSVTSSPTSQEPMFRLLGAPAKDKRHVVFEAAHVPPNELLIKEMLVDHLLGPVR